MTEYQRDVIEVLTHDHRAVEQLFAEFEGLDDTPENAGRRKTLVEQATIELVRHSVAEEAEVYPLVRERVGEGEAGRALREHAEAEETMKRIEGLDPRDPSFNTEVAQLIKEVREHVAEEEGEMFSRMRQVLTADELVDLGRRVERVKKLAPTRPHPSAPDTPPGDKVVGPLAGLVDRLRDAVTGRGRP